MKFFVQILILLLVAVHNLSGDSEQASPSTLLQRGIFTEETEGDIEAAIKIYKSIVEEAKRYQSIAAQAQFRLGLCYKRLGRLDEAESTFRRLIRQFPEQSAQVALARQELPSTERTTGPKRIREIVLPEGARASTSISGNGELVALHAGNGLHLYDTVSGTTRVISESAPLWYAGRALFSKDASQVIYSTGYKPSQIFISSTTTPDPKEILKDDDRYWVTLHDWSHTHDSIAAVRSSFENSTISLIQTDPPQIIDVLEFPKNPVSEIRFHPTEPLLVFEKKVSRTKMEIWTLDLRDKSTQEINCYRVRQLVGWSPNGHEILYIGDGSGDSALYATNPKNSTPPRLIDNHIGTFRSCQITPNGSHYVLRYEQSLNVYTAEVDFGAGTILKPPAPFTERFAGYNTRPHWSQDGKRIAYHIERPNDLRLVITDEENQNTNMIPITELTANSFIQVLFPSNSNRLILEAWGEDPEIVWFDPQTVQYSSLIPSKRNRSTGQDEINSDPHLSPDRKSLFYSKHIIDREGSLVERRHIIQHNLNTGEENIILDFTGYTSRPAPFFDWSLAPQSQRIALVATPLKSDQARLYIVDLKSNRWRPILDLPKELHIQGIEWTREEKHVVVVKEYRGGKRRNEIVSIEASTGEENPIPFDLARQRWISLHPDGKTIAFQAGDYYPPELWVTENALTSNIVK